MLLFSEHIVIGVCVVGWWSRLFCLCRLGLSKEIGVRVRGIVKLSVLKLTVNWGWPYPDIIWFPEAYQERSLNPELGESPEPQIYMQQNKCLSQRLGASLKSWSHRFSCMKPSVHLVSWAPVGTGETPKCRAGKSSFRYGLKSKIKTHSWGR